MWYRTSNRNHGFVGQIVNKESRTRFYATMLEELTKTQTEVPHTSDATRPNPAPTDTVDPSRYWMSKRSATSTDLAQWLRANENDHALHVSNQFRPLYHVDESSNRTFDLASSIICWHASKGKRTTGTNTTIRIKNAMPSFFTRIRCIYTRQSVSDPRHTTHAGWRSRRTPVLATRTSWCCRMKMRRVTARLSRTGTPGSLESTTLWYNRGPTGGGLAALCEWTFYSFDGLVSILMMERVGGVHDTCTR
jgi:hypothetical protein